MSESKKWGRVCKISNIVLSVIYVLFFWFFGFLGIMLFSLGLPDQGFNAICSFLSCLLLTLIPAFCVLSIVFSVILRKKEKYGDAFMIQFLPLAVLGMILVLFFLSIL